MTGLIIAGAITLVNGLVHVIRGGPRSGARVWVWVGGQGFVRKSYERTDEKVQNARVLFGITAIAGLGFLLIGAGGRYGVMIVSVLGVVVGLSAVVIVLLRSNR